jgi:hypothetical protein
MPTNFCIAMLKKIGDKSSFDRFQERSQKCEKRLLDMSCLSVCLPVRPHGTTRLPLEGFSLNFILEYFSKI